jgi:hypothetical protein
MSYLGISDKGCVTAMIFCVIGVVATVAGAVWLIIWLINHVRFA